MSKLVMLCIGSATQDVFLQGKVFTPECEEGVCYEHLKLGDKLSVENITFATGGNAMNAAVTFARQGLNTTFAGIVGDDPPAQAILRELDAESIYTEYVVVEPAYVTSYSVVLLAPSGERTILNYRGDHSVHNTPLFTDAMLQGDWLYVSSLGSMGTLGNLMKLAHKKGIKIAFNPATYELEHIQACADLLQYVTIFAVNKEEAQLFTEGQTPQELAKNLAKSVQYVLVSDGPKGSVATDGINIVTAGMYEDVPVVDRLGAGDAFTSGFVAMIAQEKSLEEAITFASANSTGVVSQIGAKAGILHGAQKLHDMPLEVTKIG